MKTIEILGLNTIMKFRVNQKLLSISQRQMLKFNKLFTMRRKNSRSKALSWKKSNKQKVLSTNLQKNLKKIL